MISAFLVAIDNSEVWAKVADILDCRCLDGAPEIYLTRLFRSRWMRPPPHSPVANGDKLRWNLVIHHGQRDHAEWVVAVRRVLYKYNVPRDLYNTHSCDGPV